MLKALGAGQCDVVWRAGRRHSRVVKAFSHLDHHELDKDSRPTGVVPLWMTDNTTTDQLAADTLNLALALAIRDRT